MANWTRDQLLAALNLYHQTPFGKQHKTYPPIVHLAGKIGRTPSAVAMKLSNFTSLDPVEAARDIKGLSGASNADRAIWVKHDRTSFPATDKMQVNTTIIQLFKIGAFEFN